MFGSIDGSDSDIQGYRQLQRVSCLLAARVPLPHLAVPSQSINLGAPSTQVTFRWCKILVRHVAPGEIP